jgi:hypothetical protein
VEGAEHGFSDDIFHISDCVVMLHSWNWWIEREHAELGDDGSLIWVVTCTRGSERFIARGNSPLAAWREAVRLGRSC